MSISVFEKFQKIVGKGENAGYHHFSFLLTMFSKAFHFKVVKTRDCVTEGEKKQQHYLVI